MDTKEDRQRQNITLLNVLLQTNTSHKLDTKSHEYRCKTKTRHSGKFTTSNNKKKTYLIRACMQNE